MKTLVALIVLFGCFAGLNAINCHSCDSISDSTCGDPYSADHSMDCGTFVDGCQKAVTTLNGETTVVRSCSLYDVCTAVDGCTSAGGDEACLYCCEGDDCNNAVGVGSNLVIILAGILGSYLFHF